MKWEILILAVLLMGTHVVQAQNMNLSANLTAEEQAAVNSMLTPVTKGYTLLKYVASFVAAIVLLVAGIMFMMSGGDPRKRDTAKHMATFDIVGLAIIWAAPFIVQYFT